MFAVPKYAALLSAVALSTRAITGDLPTQSSAPKAPPDAPRYCWDFNTNFSLRMPDEIRRAERANVISNEVTIAVPANIPRTYALQLVSRFIDVLTVLDEAIIDPTQRTSFTNLTFRFYVPFEKQPAFMARARSGASVVSDGDIGDVVYAAPEKVSAAVLQRTRLDVRLLSPLKGAKREEYVSSAVHQDQLECTVDLTLLEPCVSFSQELYNRTALYFMALYAYRFPTLLQGERARCVGAKGQPSDDALCARVNAYMLSQFDLWISDTGVRFYPPVLIPSDSTPIDDAFRREIGIVIAAMCTNREGGVWGLKRDPMIDPHSPYWTAEQRDEIRRKAATSQSIATSPFARVTTDSQSIAEYLSAAWSRLKAWALSW